MKRKIKANGGVFKTRGPRVQREARKGKRAPYQARPKGSSGASQQSSV